MNTNSILATFEAEIRADEREKVTKHILGVIGRALGKKPRMAKKTAYKKTCPDCGAKVKGIGVHRAMKREGKGRWNKKA